MTSTLLQQAVEALTAVRGDKSFCCLKEERTQAVVLKVLPILDSALQQQPEPVAVMHVGESQFEGWFSSYDPAGKGDKQRARDAYAAGMGDPLVTPALQQQEEPREVMTEKLLELALSLDDSRLPLATRAAYVKRELALICKERMPSPSPQDFTLPMVEEGKETDDVPASCARCGADEPSTGTCSGDGPLCALGVTGREEADCGGAAGLRTPADSGGAPVRARTGRRGSEERSGGTEMSESFGVFGAKPRGMDDPDYARFFTQARVIAWQYGFALIAHGSFTRDLDLLMVPWEARAFDGAVAAVVNRIAEVTGTKVKGDPTEKPHGRKAYTLFLSDTVRWVDLSVMPCRRSLPLPESDMTQARGE